jgi:hypothetical protein
LSVVTQKVKRGPGRPKKEDKKKELMIIDDFTKDKLSKSTNQKKVSYYYQKDSANPVTMGQPSSVKKTHIYPGTPVDPFLLQWYGARYHKSNRVTYGVAKDIFNNWFYIGNKDGELLDKLDKQAQDFANEHDLHNELVTVTFHERWGGWAIIVDWERFAEANNEQIQAGNFSVQPFEPPYKFESFHINDIENIIYDTEKWIPETYVVRKKVGGSKGLQTFDQSILVPAEFVHHLVTRPHFDKFEGQSVLDPIYFTLAQSVGIDFGAGRSFIRYGPGFPVFEQDNLADEDKTVVNTIIDNFDILNGVILPEGVTMRFEGASSAAMDPMKYVKLINQNISASTGVPVNLLEGQEVGALVAAQVNQEEYHLLLSSEQKPLKDYIREIYIKNDALPDTDEWFIWFHDSDLTKAEELKNEEQELKNESLALDNEKKKLELERLRKQSAEPTQPEAQVDPNPEEEENPEEIEEPEEELEKEDEI